MRYLIIFLLFFSQFVFSQTSNLGQFKFSSYCMTGATWSPCSGGISVVGPTSVDPSTGNTVYAWSASFAETIDQNGTVYTFDHYIDYNYAWYILCPSGQVPDGNMQCVQQCPAGQVLNVVINNGVETQQCIDDTSGSNSCSTGQTFLFGECRDAVDSPSDCANGETAIQGNDGQGYQCFPAQDCPSDYPNASTYNNATQSNTVCTAGDSASSSSFSDSASSVAASSVGDSSSGDSGGGSGGGSSSGGISGDSSASSSFSSFGSDSSGSGTGGGSASSAAGGSASSAGAGDCDPTSKDYLSCLSQGSHTVNKPDKGSFDGSISQQALSDAQNEYQQAIESIRSEISQEFGSSNFSGQGGLQDFCYSIFSQNVCFGLAKFQGDLNYIGQAVFLVACVLSFSIVVRR